MTLYSKNGGTPRELPEGDFGPDGWYYKPLAGYPDVIALCGWVEVPNKPIIDEYEQITLWDGEQWVVEDLSDEAKLSKLNDLKYDKSKQITDLRWSKQTSFTYGSRVVPSDDTAAVRVTAKVLLMQISNAASNSVVLWKFGANDFATLTLQDLINYGSAMNDHIQNCFIREATLQQMVYAANSAATVASIDITTGWE